MKKIFILFLIASLCSLLRAQTGMPDPSFGTNGYILTAPTSTGNTGFSVAKQCFVEANGEVTIVLQGNKTIITRRLADGSLDLSYGHNGYSDVVSMSVVSAAKQFDGKIIVAGTTNGTTDFMLARFTNTGTLDGSFGNNGVTITDLGSPNDYLNAVVITTDGKIIASGSTIVNGQSQFVLARYTSTGTSDVTFGINGFVTTSFDNSSSNISSLALQSDNKIVAAGTVYTNDGGDFALTRYNVDGSLDLSFNSTGTITSNFGFLDNARSVVVNNNGKIYAGGVSSDLFGYAHFRIACYNEDGSPDAGFNEGTGSVLAVFGDSYDDLTNLSLQDDGKIIASGITNLNPENNDIELIRVNTDGTIDSNFGPNGNGLVTADINSGYDEAYYLLIQPDGKIVTGGGSLTSAPPFLFTFTCYRFNIDGAPDASFGTGGSFNDFLPLGYVTYGPLFRQADEKLIVVGGTNEGNDQKAFISRFSANGTLDNTYGQNGKQEINSSFGATFFQPDGKLLALGYSPENNGDIALLRYNLDGTLDQSFGSGGMATSDFGGNESPTVAAFQSDGKIIVSAIERDDNGSDFLIVRFNVDGSIDNTFGQGGHVKMDVDNEDMVQSISIAPDGMIVIGGTGLVFPPDFFGIYSDLLIFRLNPDGSLDQGFGDHGKLLYLRSNNNYMGQVQVVDNNKIVFTDFESPDNTSYDLFLQRLNEDGSLDQTFGQNGRTPCDGASMVLQNDKKIIIVGSKVNDRNNTDVTLSRFTTDGTPDVSFGTNGRTILSFTQLDNYLYYTALSGSNLFATGTGINQRGQNVGIITKLLLEIPSSVSCPPDTTVNTGKDSCSAKVSGIDPTVTPVGTTVNYELTGATTGSGNGSASGSIFNKGVTTVTYSLTNDLTKSCSFTVTMQDGQLPTITNLTVSQTTLWPADHKMKDITVNYSVNDNCGIASTQLSISSSEPIQSGEKDDKSPDWEIIDNHHIRLRAERLESGNGRIYSITITTKDVSGNQKTATISVNVPKSMSSSGGAGFIMTVAPNPSSSYFLVTVNSRSTDNINIRLLDNKGNIVSTINNARDSQSIKIGDKLKAGIYFVEATQSGITKTVKLVKQ